MSKPPVQKREKGAGAGVGQGGAASGTQVARGRESGEALINGPGEMTVAKFHNVANFLRRGHGDNELAHIGNVGKEFLDGSDAVGGVSLPDKRGGHHFPEVFDVAEEEIVFVAVVGIESGAADFGAVEDVLNSDRLEGLFVHEGDESIAEAIASGANAAVDILFDW